jgi:uncharacterized phage protein (TIGR02218 family)
MGRSIPLALRDHLDGDATTTCLLLRIAPVRPGFAPYGLTSLDQDRVYDDGRGPVAYLAAVGTQPSLVQSSADLSVTNAEAPSLMPEFDVPVSEADIRAGALDYARFDLYLVNWADLGAGHVVLQSGTLGQVTIDEDGLSTINELRGLSVPMGQSVCEKDSLSCRATFGSQPGGSAINGPIERFACGVDAEALLIAGTVSAVSLENTLTFTVTPFTGAEDAFAPGMVFWDTGLNAQRSQEIEANTAGGQITLAHPADYPIQVGDTLRYRIDCNKQARDAVGGCKAPERWGDDWPLHFRGEPDIPIGDAGAMETPGASSGPGFGGFTQVPFPGGAL